jgi:RHH-type transcriptional regulator, rel operon repressor / antitoxin RelB
MSTSTFTIRLDPKTKERLERLAESTARSRAFLINEAVQEYLAVNEWQIKEIKHRLELADKPGAKSIPHEAVKAKWEAKLAHTMDRPGKRGPR